MNKLLLDKSGKKLNSMMGFVSDVRPTVVVLTGVENPPFSINVICRNERQQQVQPYYSDMGVWIFYPTEYGNYTFYRYTNGTQDKEETVRIDALPFYQEIDWDNKVKNLEIGSIINIPTTDPNVPYLKFIVIHQGNPDAEIYDNSFDNGTWVMMYQPLSYSYPWSSSRVGYDQQYAECRPYCVQDLTTSQELGIDGIVSLGTGFYKNRYEFKNGFQQSRDIQMSASYNWFQNSAYRYNNQKSDGFQKLINESIYNRCILNCNVPYMKSLYSFSDDSSNYYLQIRQLQFSMSKAQSCKIFHLSAYEVDKNLTPGADISCYEDIRNSTSLSFHLVSDLRDGCILDYFKQFDASEDEYLSGYYGYYGWWLRTPVNYFLHNSVSGNITDETCYQCFVSHSYSICGLKSHFLYNPMRWYNWMENIWTQTSTYYRPTFLLDKESYYFVNSEGTATLLIPNN